ncbi:MAG TPA: hypothetical protein PLA68_02305 [Panacibacter sp.]|nr:hypothetical protein [Panacibacter sp.]
MPNSRQRHKHHHQHPRQHQHTTTTKPKKRSAATLMAIFIGVFGAAIGALFSHSSILWIVTGLFIGATTGYLVGRGIDNTVARK